MFKANMGMNNVVDDDDFLGDNNYGLNPMANETLNATMTTTSLEGNGGIAPAKVKRETKDYDENAQTELEAARSKDFLNTHQNEVEEKGNKFKPHALEHLWKSKGKLTEKAKELEGQHEESAPVDQTQAQPAQPQ